jgi:hypothetical protein
MPDLRGMVNLTESPGCAAAAPAAPAAAAGAGVAAVSSIPVRLLPTVPRSQHGLMRACICYGPGTVSNAPSAASAGWLTELARVDSCCCCCHSRKCAAGLRLALDSETLKQNQRQTSRLYDAWFVALFRAPCKQGHWRSVATAVVNLTM